MWRKKVGKGTLVVTTLFKQYGLDSEVLENIWSQHAKTLGREYQAKPSRPTITETLAELEKEAGFTGPKGEANPKVNFDKNHILQVDGKPFFPHGMYQAFQLESLEAMGKAGFNTSFRITPTPEMRAAATKYGIKFIAQSSYGTELVYRPQSIAAHRLDPLVIAHDAWEEPSNKVWFNTRYGKTLTEAVKRIDPDKPTGHMLVSAVNHAAYGGFGDWWICDPYVIRGEKPTLTRIAIVLDNMYRLYPDKPAWAILQCFSNRSWDMPNPEQLRAQLYLALVHRATGIFWFVMDGPENRRRGDGGSKGDGTITYIRYADGTYEEPQWSALKKLAAEVKQITPWLVGSMKVLKSSDPKRFHAAVWTRPDSTERMLVVVNLTAQILTADIDTTNQPMRLTKPLFKDSIPYERISNRYRFKLAPYGVGVYLTK
jgi:hypothetical protein